MKYRLALATVLVLSACASTPAADLAVAETSLTAIEQSAYSYTTLPICGTEKQGQLCKTLAAEKTIQTSKKVADSALAAAKSATTAQTVTNLQAAISTLTSLVPVNLTPVGGN